MTEKLIGKVMVLHKNNVSLSGIADIIGKSKTAVAHCIHRIANNGGYAFKGRVSKVTERQRRSIIRQASNKVVTSKIIRANLNSP